MTSEIKIYTISDFVRKNESGELSRDRLKAFIAEIVTVASAFPHHNILIDSRDTTISYEIYMTDILEAAGKLSVLKNIFIQKIANIIPTDKTRLSIASKAEVAINFKGLQYRVFTDFEDAIEWLSEVKI
jgi:hypothetical protein